MFIAPSVLDPWQFDVDRYVFLDLYTGLRIRILSFLAVALRCQQKIETVEIMVNPNFLYDGGKIRIPETQKPTDPEHWFLLPWRDWQNAGFLCIFLVKGEIKDHNLSGLWRSAVNIPNAIGIPT